MYTVAHFQQVLAGQTHLNLDILRDRLAARLRAYETPPDLPEPADDACDLTCFAIVAAAAATDATRELVAAGEAARAARVARLWTLAHYTAAVQRYCHDASIKEADLPDTVEDAATIAHCKYVVVGPFEAFLPCVADRTAVLNRGRVFLSLREMARVLRLDLGARIRAASLPWLVDMARAFQHDPRLDELVRGCRSVLEHRVRTQLAESGAPAEGEMLEAIVRVHATHGGAGPVISPAGLRTLAGEALPPCDARAVLHAADTGHPKYDDRLRLMDLFPALGLSDTVSVALLDVCMRGMSPEEKKAVHVATYLKKKRGGSYPPLGCHGTLARGRCPLGAEKDPRAACRQAFEARFNVALPVLTYPHEYAREALRALAPPASP